MQELTDTVIYHNEMIIVYAAAGVSCNTAHVCVTAYRAQVCRNGYYTWPSHPTFLVNLRVVAGVH